MGDFNPAWFIAGALGFILLAIDILIPEERRKRIGWVLLSVGLLLFFIGVVGVGFDVYKKFNKPQVVIEKPQPQPQSPQPTSPPVAPKPSPPADNKQDNITIDDKIKVEVKRPPAIKAEVHRAAPLSTPDSHPIQISAVFYEPKDPCIVITNSSDSVAEGVGWSMVAIRRSDLSYFGFAGQSVGYVKPHTDSARYSLELDKIAKGSDPVGEQIHDDDELIGSVSIDCPRCEARTYIVHLVWKQSGWFFEYSKAAGKHLVPRDMSNDGRTRYVELFTGDSFRSARVEILPKPQ